MLAIVSTWGKTAHVATLRVPSLGDYIREQRQSAQVSLRQLARSAGVSNPYLSQIERGIKKPSAEILQQIAKGLRISAETLYVHAGFLDERHDGAAGSGVVAAVLADPAIDDRHKRALVDIYESFRAEHTAAARTPVPQKTVAKKTPAKKSVAKKSVAKQKATKRTAPTKSAGTANRRKTS